MKNPLTAQLGELVTGIDHVAIAVADIDTSIAWYTSVLGFSLASRNEVSGDHTGMSYAVMISGNATVVLVQGTSPESQVSKFMAAFGAGMHHIALAVTDLDEAISRAKAAGVIADTPVVNDDGIRQTFLQRDPATGVRVELIERHGKPFSERNVEQLFRIFEEKNLY